MFPVLPYEKKTLYIRQELSCEIIETGAVMSLSPNQLDQGAQHNMTIEGSSLRERQRPHARVCAIPRKAPHQQVIDEMKNEPMTPDRDFLIRNYPNLMNFYEDDLESVYEAAEEACCRIIAGTELPDFLQTLGDHSTADHSSTATKRQFYEAINDIQRNPLQKPNRGNLPREAVEKFKAWFEANEDHPCALLLFQILCQNEFFSAYSTRNTFVL